jgi:hypothetical protein
MARARNIKPGFFKNEDLAEIEPLGRLLFAGLWTLADREGRMEDRPKRIKAELLPYDNCNADALLDELHDRGFILRYSVEGERYIVITAFDKHQNPHRNESDSVIPCPDMHSAVTDHGPEDDLPRTEAVQEMACTAPADSLFSDSLFSDSLISESLFSDSLSKTIVAGPDEPDPQPADMSQDDTEPEGKDKAPAKLFSPAGPEYKLAVYLQDKIKALDPKAREPNMQTWASEIDKMIRIDNRSAAEVKDIIDFAHKDPFWRSNILSPKKLREKATTLISKMNGGPGKAEQFRKSAESGAVAAFMRRAAP